jgi:hypothetical protein
VPMEISVCGHWSHGAQGYGAYGNLSVWSLEPWRSRPRCLWKSLCVNSLEPRCSLELLAQGCPRRCVCDTGSRGRTGAGNREESYLYCKQLLCIHFASGGFFPPSSRKEIFLCQAVRIA